MVLKKDNTNKSADKQNKSNKDLVFDMKDVYPNWNKKEVKKINKSKNK